MEGPFVQVPRGVVQHILARRLSVNAYRIFMFLLEEHMSHAGTENGRLAAPYNQLEGLGIRRNSIRPALLELIEAGLIRRTDEGYMRQIARYELTFLHTRDRETGVSVAASDLWKRRPAPPSEKAETQAVSGV
ncbi:hypothetical protein [Elstera sp.]|jgi:hypothetical protein|uniref:hypothetical protein n=1 Tax=Elstera sp. TaxID=1916664 RepID=UPI0037BEC1E3